MIRTAIIAAGTCVSFFLLWFALKNLQEAGPLAEENLRGLALSMVAAIENLAVHDLTLAALNRFHPDDLAYFALVDRRGVYRFHSNPDLIGTPAHDAPLPAGFPQLPSSEARLTRVRENERSVQRPPLPSPRHSVPPPNPPHLPR